MKFFKNQILRLIIASLILMVSVFIDNKYESPNFFTYLAAISGVYVLITFIIFFIGEIYASINAWKYRKK